MSAITLRSPEAAVASIPFLLGFTPQRSLVTIGITTDDHGARRVGLVSRTDLPDEDVNLAEYAATITEPFTRNEISAAVVFIVVDDTSPQQALHSGVAPRAELADELADAGAQRFDDVLDVLYTDGASYTSYLCQDSSCPCANGEEISQQTLDAVAAEFIGAGVAPAAGRDDIAAEWDTSVHTEDYRSELVRLCTTIASDGAAPHVPPQDPDERLQQYAAAGATIRALASGHDTLELAHDLARANTDIRLRDALIIHTAALSATEAAQVATTARGIGIDLPEGAREAAAVLSGVGHYLAGDGVRAVLAAEAALAVNSDSNMGRMLHTAVTAGLPPAQFAHTMASLTPEQVMGITPTTPQAEPAASSPATASLTPAPAR